MEISEKIYGTVFFGAIAVGLLYLAFALWNDNFIFALLLGLFGIVIALYSIGLFLIPLVNLLKKKK